MFVKAQNSDFSDSSPMATDNNQNQVMIPNIQEPTKPLTMIIILNSIKLTSTNYLSWKLQMEAILIGYDLHKFIDGSYTAPTTTVPGVSNLASSR